MATRWAGRPRGRETGQRPAPPGSSGRPGWFRPRAALAVVLLPWLLLAQGPPTRLQVEAAYLYQFGHFVHWPRMGHGAFTICVLGNDPFGPVLPETLAGQKLQGHPVGWRQIASATQAHECRIVFVGSVPKQGLAAVLPQLEAAGALTVSDLPDFAREGGAIGFVVQRRHVRFIINREAAQRAGLRLSSQLLKVAAAVLPRAHAGAKP